MEKKEKDHFEKICS